MPTHDVVGDPEPEGHCTFRFGDAEHERIADRLHLARAIRGELGLHGVAEVRHELGCFLVAVRFGQGGDPAISAKRKVAAVGRVSFSSIDLDVGEGQLHGAFGVQAGGVEHGHRRVGGADEEVNLGAAEKDALRPTVGQVAHDAPILGS